MCDSKSMPSLLKQYFIFFGRNNVDFCLWKFKQKKPKKIIIFKEIALLKFVLYLVDCIMYGQDKLEHLQSETNCALNL